MDKIIFIIVAVIIIAGAIFWLVQSGFFAKGIPSNVNPAPLPAGIVLFYGQGCPHCADVEKFISDNKIDEKLKITRMEVWYNQSNQLTLGEVVQKCGIDAKTVGVPFLYDGN